MVKGKIIYDSEIMTFKEWESSINRLKERYPDIGIPNTMEFNYLEEVQAHYFFILNNSPGRISFWIRSQISSQLGASSIIWDAKLDSGKNWEIYYVDTPQKIEIRREPVFDRKSSWKNDKTLRFKGPKALRSLAEELRLS